MTDILKKHGYMAVGLCGRSGSGKGYVSDMFSKLGIPSIDTDGVYRKMTAPAEGIEMLSPCMKELVSHFGSVILSSDFSLDRAVMRSLVFSGNNSDALSELNRITHKHILAETMHTANILYGKGNDIILIDAPLLYESGFDKMCERVVCVTASEEALVRRIIRRDGLSSDDAVRRLASQKSRVELEEKADFVLCNDGNDTELLTAVENCAAALRKIRAELYCQG